MSASTPNARNARKAPNGLASGILLSVQRVRPADSRSALDQITLRPSSVSRASKKKAARMTAISRCRMPRSACQLSSSR